MCLLLPGFLLLIFCFEDIYSYESYKNSRLNFQHFYIGSFFKRNFDEKKECDGDLNRILVITKAKDKNKEIGISGFKRVGEKFTIDYKTNRYIFNTYTFYAVVNNEKICENIILKKFILGHFKLGYGQGLVFNYKNERFHKAINQIKIFKKQKGIVKCKSHKKKKFVGIGGTFLFANNIEITIFFSVNSIDALIKDNYVYTACLRDKYLKDITVITEKDKLKSFITGGTILYSNKKNMDFGINCVYTKFNNKFNLINNSDLKGKEVEDIDNLFKGDQNINCSYFSTLKFGLIKIVFEHAHSLNSFKYIKKHNNYGHGFLIGTKINICNPLKYVALFRYYSPTYHSFYGNAFSTYYGSDLEKIKNCANNEIGLYNAVQINILRNLPVKISSDFSYYPSRTFSFNNAFHKHSQIDIFYTFGFFEYIHFNCRFDKKNKTIYDKYINRESILEEENCKINTTIKKRILNIVNKTKIYTTFNTKEKIKKESFSLGLYEKISYKRNNTEISILFVITNAGKKTPIIILNRHIENNSKIPIVIYKPTIKTALIVTKTFHRKTKIEIMYSFTVESQDKSITCGTTKINTFNKLYLNLLYSI